MESRASILVMAAVAARVRAAAANSDTAQIGDLFTQL
jgi:hypothetical protein